MRATESIGREALPAYFDTSAVIKQYIAERGSEQARELFRKYQVVSSILMPLELLSGLRRRVAGGDISQAAYGAALLDLADDRARWELVSVEADILRHAERLVRQIVVRTIDAIHVASALFVAEAAGTLPPFVTADAQQRAAAEAAGLEVVWVA